MPVVCATRFTGESHRAVAAAAALAKRRNERLYLAHVVSSGGFFGGRASPGNFQASLDAEVARLTAEGISVTGEVLNGKCELALAKYCADREAGLLVVGDTEKAPALMASSLDRFALVVDVPLVVVRDEKPFVNWGNDSPLKVMLAFDQTAASAVARDWLARLSEFGPIHLLATQVYVPEDEYAERGMTPPPAEEGHTALGRVIKKELARAFEGLPPQVTLSARAEVSNGDVADQLLFAASAEKADLVLVGNHRRRALSRLRSISHKLLLRSPASVACVPTTTPVPDIGPCPSWERLLVVIDLTESGSRAIAWAASLLKPGHVLHVVYVSEAPVSKDEEASLKKRMQQSLPLHCEDQGGDVLLHVLQGDPPVALAAAADHFEADALVMGALDVPKFEEEFVVAPQMMEQWRQWRLVQTLLETTHRPVLVTPPLRA